MLTLSFPDKTKFFPATATFFAALTTASPCPTIDTSPSTSIAASSLTYINVLPSTVKFCAPLTKTKLLRSNIS